MVVVHGPSGCGKTTLLNLIGGLDRPESGRVLSCGTELTHASRPELTAYRARSVGFIFQFYNLLPTLTALENVEAGVRVAGSSATRRVSAARRCWGGSASGTSRAASRPSSPAASSSASRSPAPSPSDRACCWPTSRPATSTRRPRPGCWS